MFGAVLGLLVGPTADAYFLASLMHVQYLHIASHVPKIFLRHGALPRDWLRKALPSSGLTLRALGTPRVSLPTPTSAPVSLDDADHLLSKESDAQYVADLIASWVQRYVPAPQAKTTPHAPEGVVRVAEVQGSTFLQQELLSVADRCPVHKTLHNSAVINTLLASE